MSENEKPIVEVEKREKVDHEESVELTDDTIEKKEGKPKFKDAKTRTLQGRVDELEKKNKELLDRTLRLQAEFENFRKRNSSIRTDALIEGNVEAIMAVLPVLDNFERALEFQGIGDIDEGFVSGVKIVYDQLNEKLAKLGLEQIDDSCKFDPNLHEAVMQDDSGEFETGTITAVMQKGYKVYDRVIRHTMVRVAI